MKNTQKRPSISISKEADKPNLNSDKEELIKRTYVIDSPFVIITTDGKSFGTLNKYRITELYDTVEEVNEELGKITWNRLIQVMMIVNETLKK